MQLALYLYCIPFGLIIIANLPSVQASHQDQYVGQFIVDQYISSSSPAVGSGVADLSKTRRASIYDETINIKQVGGETSDYSDNVDSSGSSSNNLDTFGDQLHHIENHEHSLIEQSDINKQHSLETNSSQKHHYHHRQATQKRYLTRELIREACELDRGSQRDEHINNSYLTHCSRYKMENLLSSELLMSIMHQDTRDCARILEEFLQLDEMIEQFDQLFKKLLTRYNCHNGYSVKWSCEDCKSVYTDWICATHLPFYMNGERIKPCISFCERVEQRCPYLHPITREQYGGQPVFICRDPNIPFVPAITPEILYNEPGRCYDLCHLSDNLTELITDSLSKYDYDKCPDKSSIAEEVRNDPYYCGSTHCSAVIRPPLGQLDDDDGGGGGKLKTADQAEVESQMDKINENMVILANGTSKVVFTKSKEKRIHVHKKKLEELREVLANYKNQAKTHRYHADHSSIYHQTTNIQH